MSAPDTPHPRTQAPPTGPDRHGDAAWADEPVTVPRSLLLAAWAACNVRAEDLPVAALLAAYLWETP